jgi:hypothetical protein
MRDPHLVSCQPIVPASNPSVAHGSTARPPSLPAAPAAAWVAGAKPRSCMAAVIRCRKGVMAIPPDIKRKAVRRYRHMEPGQQQAVRGDQKGWGCDSARERFVQRTLWDVSGPRCPSRHHCGGGACFLLSSSVSSQHSHTARGGGSRTSCETQKELIVCYARHKRRTLVVRLIE